MGNMHASTDYQQSTLEQAGKISSNFFSIDKGFSLSTNIIILSSIALFILASLLVAGFTSNRASKKTEEINKVEEEFSSKVLEKASVSQNSIDDIQH